MTSLAAKWKKIEKLILQTGDGSSSTQKNLAHASISPGVKLVNTLAFFAQRNHKVRKRNEKWNFTHRMKYNSCLGELCVWQSTERERLEAVFCYCSIRRCCHWYGIYVWFGWNQSIEYRWMRHCEKKKTKKQRKKFVFVELLVCPCTIIHHIFTLPHWFIWSGLPSNFHLHFNLVCRFYITVTTN